jgi:hypothetical protein
MVGTHVFCGGYCRWRPYRVECTGSLPTSEVKRRRARLVLGWGTAREDLRVLPAFYVSVVGRAVICKRRCATPCHYALLGTLWFAKSSSRFIRHAVTIAHVSLLCGPLHSNIAGRLCQLHLYHFLAPMHGRRAAMTFMRLARLAIYQASLQFGGRQRYACMQTLFLQAASKS